MSDNDFSPTVVINTEYHIKRVIISRIVESVKSTGVTDENQLSAIVHGTSIRIMTNFFQCPRSEVTNALNSGDITDAIKYLYDKYNKLCK